MVVQAWGLLLYYLEYYFFLCSRICSNVIKFINMPENVFGNMFERGVICFGLSGRTVTWKALE